MTNYSYVVMEYKKPHYNITPYKVFLDNEQAFEFAAKHNDWYKEMCNDEGIEYDWRMNLWIEEIELITK